MLILASSINRINLIDKCEVVFDDTMIKAVVDVEKKQIAIDAELHSDLEALLLDSGSQQEYLWGINLYPNDDEFVEFDSLINIRPQQNNRSRSVEDMNIQASIMDVVELWIK